MRIEICGGIASGKTTLAQLLVRLDLVSALENFQNNPFWQAFYVDPAANAFETEIGFLLQHYHDIKTATKGGHCFVCDFSVLLDLAYARVTLSENRRRAFLAVYDEVRRELPLPALLIHLQCSPHAELERIHRRGRRVEDSITIDYLQQINSQLDQVLADEPSAKRKMVINSEQLDFANDDQTKRLVLDAISRELEQPSISSR